MGRAADSQLRQRAARPQRESSCGRGETPSPNLPLPCQHEHCAGLTATPVPSSAVSHAHECDVGCDCISVHHHCNTLMKVTCSALGGYSHHDRIVFFLLKQPLQESSEGYPVRFEMFSVAH